MGMPIYVIYVAWLLCVTAAANEPYGYPPKTIQPMNPGECPSNAERYELLTTIQQEIREDLQTLTQEHKGSKIHPCIILCVYISFQLSAYQIGCGLCCLHI